ncbi:RuvA C-terminal domain-containing protein [Ralstonia sp. ASV6]|uniref:RuvA C-terminal domain-containing protein n=1 Tax=Ralstonia sp. ASV6 TaxID=2795124 RepID=UPI0018ECF790|nr:RuvA C-terminal domain-containing protein [Ralstonia sp. ASV6]
MRDVSQIVAEVAHVDDGFCNPLKIKAAAEAREDAVNELQNLGYSRDEAEQMIADAG